MEGYRYPTLTLDLGHSPHLAPAWLGTPLSGRIDATNISDVRTQHVNATVSTLLEGRTQTIDQFLWDVVANCFPYQPWRVGVAVANTDSNALRGDTDASVLDAGASAGASSLSVAVTAGPLWTTEADDFPFDVSAAGVRVTVTAITGGSSPQTFTVDPVASALPAGGPVALWDPPVLG